MWSPHNATVEQTVGKKGGGGQDGEGGLFPQEPESFSVGHASRSGGKGPHSHQYLSFLGTSQGKLSLPKWP